MKLSLKIKKPHSKEDGAFYLFLKKLIGYKPNELRYYKKAFTHRSVNIKDSDGKSLNYERLEFLGDAILGTIISKYLFDHAPKRDEGYLTKMRSKIVSRKHLNELGKELGLLHHVKSKIESSHFGENIYGNVFEALVGAIYLDLGYDTCEKFIYSKIIHPHVDLEQLEGKVISYKSLLIEWCQKEKLSFKFESYEDSGAEVQKHFGVKLFIDSKQVSKSRSTSKKKAEEIASKRAYFVFQDKIESRE